MKKFLTIFMALLLCVGLAGCGSEEEAETSFRSNGNIKDELEEDGWTLEMIDKNLVELENDENDDIFEFNIDDEILKYNGYIYDENGFTYDTGEVINDLITADAKDCLKKYDLSIEDIIEFMKWYAKTQVLIYHDEVNSVEDIIKTFEDMGFRESCTGDLVDGVKCGFINGDTGEVIVMNENYDIIYFNRKENGTKNFVFYDKAETSNYMEEGTIKRACKYDFKTKEFDDWSDNPELGYNACDSETKEKLKTFHIDNFLEGLGIDKEVLRKYLEEQVDNYISSNNL